MFAGSECPSNLEVGMTFGNIYHMGNEFPCFAKYVLASFSKDTVVALATEIWLSFGVVRGEVYLHRLRYRSK